MPTRSDLQHDDHDYVDYPDLLHLLVITFASIGMQAARAVGRHDCKTRKRSYDSFTHIWILKLHSGWATTARTVRRTRIHRKRKRVRSLNHFQHATTMCRNPRCRVKATCSLARLHNRVAPHWLRIQQVFPFGPLHGHRVQESGQLCRKRGHHLLHASKREDPRSACFIVWFLLLRVNYSITEKPLCGSCHSSCFAPG